MFPPLECIITVYGSKPNQIYVNIHQSVVLELAAMTGSKVGQTEQCFYSWDMGHMATLIHTQYKSCCRLKGFENWTEKNATIFCFHVFYIKNIFTGEVKHIKDTLYDKVCGLSYSVMMTEEVSEKVSGTHSFKQFQMERINKTET